MATKGICSTCGSPAVGGKHSSMHYRCMDCNSALSSAYRKQRRDECFELLGGCCAECGFDDPRAFQIDHLNGGGRRHRQSLNNSPTRLYRHVLQNPDAYQLLCANCNQIKRMEIDQLRTVI